MKTLYIECSMGVSGDMLVAALTDLFPDREEIVSELNSLGIPGVSFHLSDVSKCGILGRHMTVLVNGEEEGDGDHHHDHTHEHHHDHHHDDHHHEHHHHSRGMAEIEDIVKKLDIPDRVKDDVLKVYSLIAGAESSVHGKSVSEIHFHELGTMDAIADITAVSSLIRKLSPERIVSSPLNLGSGTVKCAHGILPVPAPAVSLLIKGMPVYSDGTEGELTTPTGAALIKYFADSFGVMPEMDITGTGVGTGSRDYPRPNCIRVFEGDSSVSGMNGIGDRVAEISCNIDDMTGEEIGYAVERLLFKGALDVFTTPVGMKKNRPGTMLTVLCMEDDLERFEDLIFKYTSTLGLRFSIRERRILERKEEEVSLPSGGVRIKHSSGYGAERVKPEYEDVAKIARERDISYREALSIIDKAL